MYDIIGDVHGHYRQLKTMLVKLGYKKTQDGYFHADRKAVFVGDFINRGPEIRKTVRTIRSMVESGSGYAILGNHELNAIIYHLKDKSGFPLVKQPRKYFLSLYKTLSEFSKYPDEWKSHLKWMRGLPLAIDFGKIRVVHACWSENAIQNIKEATDKGRIKKSTFRNIYNQPESELAKSIWLVTKGVSMNMPGDLRIITNKGISARSIRLRWWEKPDGKTFEKMSFESKCIFPSYTIPEQIIPGTFPYSKKEPIVFFGHYCRNKGPHLVKPNICCVDSCVAGSNMLTAYRWNGEEVLNKENLIQVFM